MSRAWREPARLLVFLVCFCAFGTGWALDVPPLTGRIVDLAHIMPTDVAAELTAELEAHETKAGNQVAVLILPSLDGEPFESFSHLVATTWALGKKGTDNGVLLVVALRERKVRIEVGYGLEGTLTDLHSARIVRNDIVPRFRAGDMPGGIVAGVRTILRTIEGTEPTPMPEAPESRSLSAMQYVVVGIIVGTLAGLILSQGLHRTRAFMGSLLAFLIAQSGSLLLGVVASVITAFLLLLFLQTGRGGGRGRHVVWGPGTSWSGGGFGGGGGFSGGGGDFGGGGASGDW